MFLDATSFTTMSGYRMLLTPATIQIMPLMNCVKLKYTDATKRLETAVLTLVHQTAWTDNVIRRRVNVIVVSQDIRV